MAFDLCCCQATSTPLDCCHGGSLSNRRSRRHLSSRLVEFGRVVALHLPANHHPRGRNPCWLHLCLCLSLPPYPINLLANPRILIDRIDRRFVIRFRRTIKRISVSRRLYHCRIAIWHCRACFSYRPLIWNSTKSVTNSSLVWSTIVWLVSLALSDFQIVFPTHTRRPRLFADCPCPTCISWSYSALMEVHRKTVPENQGGTLQQPSHTPVRTRLTNQSIIQ